MISVCIKGRVLFGEAVLIENSMNSLLGQSSEPLSAFEVMT